MPDSPAAFPLPLPDRPDLRHLKDQAKDLVKSGAAATLAAAQLRIARQYGFPSWPRLKAHVESSRQVSRLKRAIDTNDLPVVKALMSASPALHRAPLGYGKNGPLTWVAECRIPWEPPTATRLAMAQWMIDHGSDVHQGGDGPLMRAALAGYRVPMMELLVANGANVNAQWNGDFPIILAPCETVDPVSLQWLLEHGARPVFAGDPGRDTALDYVIATYLRTERLPACIDLLVAAGCPTRFGSAAVLAILRGSPRVSLPPSSQPMPLWRTAASMNSISAALPVAACSSPARPCSTWPPNTAMWTLPAFSSITAPTSMRPLRPTPPA